MAAHFEGIVQRVTIGKGGKGFAGFDGFAAHVELAQGHPEAVELSAGEQKCEPTSELGYETPELGPILAGCAFLRHCKEDASILSEPEWYAALGVVGRCREGESLAHEISKPYPGYSKEETDQKLKHAMEAAGPMRCETVEEKFGASYCTDCTVKGAVNSPISLGYGQAAESKADQRDGGFAGFAGFGDDGQSAEPETEQAEPWPDPKPLDAVLPEVEEFDVAILPHVLLAFVADIADRMQVPIDFVVAPLLVALGAVIGRRALIQPKTNDSSWRFPPNLWGGIVGRPARKKTPAIDAALAPLRRLEHEAQVQNAEMKEAYEAELELWKERKAKYSKGNAGERYKEPKPTPPVYTRYIVNDGTIEKIHDLLVDNPVGLIVFRDELAGFFSTLDTKGRERDRPFMIEGANGTNGFTMDRIGRGTVYVQFVTLSLLGGSSPTYSPHIWRTR